MIGNLIRIGLTSLLVVSSVFAEDKTSGTGEISLETRTFRSDKNAATEDRGFALFSRVETSAAKGDLKGLLRVFGRVDHFDAGRDFIRFEDAYLQWTPGNWTLRGGYQVFNWSEMEAFHPADVLNSRNFDGDLERLEKFGELSLSLGRAFGPTEFSFYVFPKFEGPLFPSSKSRLGIRQSVGKPKWVEGRNFVSTDEWGKIGQTYGARFQWRFTGGDLAFHMLRIMDRQAPVFYFDGFNNRPYFFMVEQYGLTFQHVLLDGLLFKFEGAYRDFIHEQEIYNILGNRRPQDNIQSAFGLERTFATDSGAENTLLLEYQKFFMKHRDNAHVINQLNSFPNHALLGYRFALNDVQGKELFLSWMTSLDKGRQNLYNLSYSQRISDVWKMKLGLRKIEAPPRRNIPQGLEILDKADQAYVHLTRYF